MEYIYCVLMGYAVGCVNPSYLIAQKKGFDIRKKGSGNAGASNALILFGKLVGIACALFDIFKALLVIILAETLFPARRLVFAVTGVACIIGHVFPFYMGFKGGKGLACLGGMILCFDPRVFFVMLTIEIFVAILTDYICFVPLSASVIFPFVYGFMRRDATGAVIIAVIAFIMFAKHAENLKRIKNGTEMHFSYLWKPNDEIERLKDVLGEEEATVESHFARK